MGKLLRTFSTLLPTLLLAVTVSSDGIAGETGLGIGKQPRVENRFSQGHRRGGFSASPQRPRRGSDQSRRGDHPDFRPGHYPLFYRPGYWPNIYHPGYWPSYNDRRLPDDAGARWRRY